MDPNCSRIEGGKSLGGAVAISGSKNTCLPLLAATLLTEETCTLRNVPQLTDIACMIEIIGRLGAKVNQIDAHTFSIEAKRITTHADRELVGRFRASVYTLGALLGRKGSASVAIPGGCKLGERPIDIHLHAFEALGATVTQEPNYVHLQANPLKGAAFSMQGPRGPTLTGTANAILAAVLAPGKSIISGAAREPEVVSLCLFLKKMGAKINGIGSDRIEIQGVSSLHGADFTVQPDRMEAGTFLILGLLCCDSLRILNAPRDILCGFPNIIPNINHYAHWEGDDFMVHRGENLSPLDVYTKWHPGFPTDLQAQIAVLASQIEGTSHIHDTIFPERFAYVDAFQKLGINVKKMENGTIAIGGKNNLKGAEIMATDLRAGAAMYLAALIAEGETFVSRTDYIDRGYENFEVKLRALGAAIECETKISPMENIITSAQKSVVIIVPTEEQSQLKNSLT
ncbi:MAG: UDP-N-acetylglucosamine 1-carboxyvinyltransferase [Puniceicoccales bacterium]|nr:UDP-N-acetylglucosamine 1-carboxyvinyltransferase [Puniceicoccales bacterium]